MVVVFLSFVLGADVSVKQIGLGLAVAVLIDATVVRMVLVPAVMELLGRANWWLPAPLGEPYTRQPRPGCMRAPRSAEQPGRWTVACESAIRPTRTSTRRDRDERLSAPTRHPGRDPGSQNGASGGS
jgi:hypothetical protein